MYHIDFRSVFTFFVSVFALIYFALFKALSQKQPLFKYTHEHIFRRLVVEVISKSCFTTKPLQAQSSGV